MSFTLCHMRGFPTYKMNVALFFSSRMFCGGAVVSTVATSFLRASSHPCNWCSPPPRLHVLHCWFWDLTDWGFTSAERGGSCWSQPQAQDTHWEELSRSLLSLSAIQKVTRKNRHEIKRAANKSGKMGRQQTNMEDRRHGFTWLNLGSEPFWSMKLEWVPERWQAMWLENLQNLNGRLFWDIEE